VGAAAGHPLEEFLLVTGAVLLDRSPACENLVQHHAEAPDVTLGGQVDGQGEGAHGLVAKWKWMLQSLRTAELMMFHFKTGLLSVK
jgi:hypothetical protein